MKQLNLYYLGGGGGGSVPDGKTVTPINDVVIWQKCAGISNPTYTTLAEMLSDTGILQTLMASNNAVDYMVRSKEFIGIGALVPIMTSDNTPSGVCSASAVHSTPYAAWKAFDGDDTTWWSTPDGQGTGSWLQYEFATAQKAMKAYVVPYDATGHIRTFKIQASNDGNTWTDISETVTIISASGIDVPLTSAIAYKYYRLYVITSNNCGNIRTLQFSIPGICQSSDAMYYVGQNNYCADTLLADLEWRTAICGSTYRSSVQNTEVPIMTGYTTPSGKARASGEYNSSYAAYYAFQRNSNMWVGNSGNEHWLEYDFKREVEVIEYKFQTDNNADRQFNNHALQGSNDEVIWHDMDRRSVSTSANATYTYISAATRKFRYWRIDIEKNGADMSHAPALKQVRFFAREDV